MLLARVIPNLIQQREVALRPLAPIRSERVALDSKIPVARTLMVLTSQLPPIPLLDFIRLRAGDVDRHLFVGPLPTSS